MKASLKGSILTPSQVKNVFGIKAGSGPWKAQEVVLGTGGCGLAESHPAPCLDTISEWEKQRPLASAAWVRSD